MTKYFLGLDWGKSKIGVALADDETRMAFAHSVIKNDDRVFDVLKGIIEEYAVEMVVVGMPSGYAHATDAKDTIEAFAGKIGKDFGVEVEFFREMFTTKMAQANLAESGRGKHLDDQEAARLILQEWLDAKR